MNGYTGKFIIRPSILRFLPDLQRFSRQGVVMTTPTKAPAQPAPKFECETRKFTVEEYYRMAEAGILQPDERVELVNGEILIMPPIGEPHAVGVDNLTLSLAEIARGRFVVRIQNPVRLNDGSELQPDCAVLRLRQDSYRDSHPGPSDVLLIVEVSDTTLSYDRQVKAALYAQAGIAEIWVMNLQENCVEVFTQPGPEGYGQQALFLRGDVISPSMLPGVEFAVEDLLPPVVEQPDNV